MFAIAFKSLRSLLVHRQKWAKMASFAKRVATTYVTFVGANACSNFVLFPSYKLDYGLLNE